MYKALVLAPAMNVMFHVHRCLGCHVDRHNRVAADDDPDFVIGLPRIEPRD